MLTFQWPFRTSEYRHFRIAKLGGIQRIPAGLLHSHVSGNGGDSQNLYLRRAQRHDQRHGVIGSGIGINQKWTIHAMQDNKLARETRHENPRDLSRLAACPAGRRKNRAPSPLLPTSQPAAASADASDWASVVVPADLAVISSPFLFISNLCFRSRPLTNSRAALPTAPGRFDASTLIVDSTFASLRST